MSHEHGHREEGRHSARRQQCWMPEDAGDRHSHGLSARSLRENASNSHPNAAPDLGHPSRHEPQSLASLDEVLREMKAMIRSAPDGISDSMREDIKAQERSRQAAVAAKVSSANVRPVVRTSRTSTGTGRQVGHRAAAVGRGADTGTDDRSPSAQRSAQRRHPSQRSDRAEHRTMSRQRSQLDDELDFATAENYAMGGSQRTPQRGDRGHTEAPTPPWEQSRKPLETLEPEGNNDADLGPPVPWARGSSMKNLQGGYHDYNSAAIGNAKVHGVGGHHQRQLSRSGSTAKRVAANENHISGLGFIF